MVLVAYDKLIFATGSKAFVIPVPGSTLPSVLVQNNDDTEQMMNIAKTKKKAIVIGGGFTRFRIVHVDCIKIKVWR